MVANPLAKKEQKDLWALAVHLALHLGRLFEHLLDPPEAH